MQVTSEMIGAARTALGRFSLTTDLEIAKMVHAALLAMPVPDAGAETVLRCCICRSPAVAYWNYREQPFCGACANGEPVGAERAPFGTEPIFLEGCHVGYCTPANSTLEPEVTVDGLDGPGVRDATGQLPAEVYLRGYSSRQDIVPEAIGGNDGRR